MGLMVEHKDKEEKKHQQDKPIQPYFHIANYGSYTFQTANSKGAAKTDLRLFRSQITKLGILATSQK